MRDAPRSTSVGHSAGTAQVELAGTVVAVMTQPLTVDRPSIAEGRRQYRAQVLANFTPAVPGLPGNGAPVILHEDTERALTYTWHDRSTDIADAGPRESGMETSLLTVTHGPHRVGYLRISFTNRAILDATFPDPFHFADETTGASFGFKYGTVTPATVWATAHQDLNLLPASWNGKRPAGASRWAMDPKDAPTDPAVLAADLKVAARAYAKQMRGFLNTFKAPFVAYSHVDNQFDAQASGDGHPGNLRGTGVGRTMYLLAAQHLATTGRPLLASGIQTSEAQALWGRLVADPAVPTRRTKRTYYRTGKASTMWCLDYTRR